MGVKFANAARSVLSAGITAVQTTIVVQGGTGARFPALAIGDYFWALLKAPTGEMEIVKVTARSGDTLTVVRGQEGTTPFAFSAGHYIANVVTAGQLGFFWNPDNDGQGSGLDADKLDGYETTTGTAANAVPVRDANGKLPGDILGNAATATNATNAANAALLDGFDSSQAATANTVAVRDANGKLAGDITGNAATATAAGTATNVSGGTASVTTLSSSGNTALAGGKLNVDATTGQQTSQVPGTASVLPDFGARAFVHFEGNGVNGAQTIRASGNVASVVRTAPGFYTVTFSTPMPDAFYTVGGACQENGNGGAFVCFQSGATNTAAVAYVETGRIPGTLTPRDCSKNTLVFHR